MFQIFISKFPWDLVSGHYHNLNLTNDPGQQSVTWTLSCVKIFQPDVFNCHFFWELEKCEQNASEDCFNYFCNNKFE